MHKQYAVKEAVLMRKARVSIIKTPSTAALIYWFVGNFWWLPTLLRSPQHS